MYLDANLFVFAWAATEQGKRARALLDEVVRGRTAVTSALVIDEVMWGMRRNRQVPADIRALVEEIYRMPNLSIKDVPATAPLRALDFMDRYNLKPRDACHLAVMENFGITEIATDDKDFDRIPGIKRIKI